LFVYQIQLTSSAASVDWNTILFLWPALQEDNLSVQAPK